MLLRLSGEVGSPGGFLGLARSLPSGLAHLGLVGCQAWYRQELGCFQICFHFQFPLLLNHLRATENKLLSSADLRFLASIVCPFC